MAPIRLAGSRRTAKAASQKLISDWRANGLAVFQLDVFRFQFFNFILQLDDFVRVVRLRLGPGQTLPQLFQFLLDDFVSFLSFFVHRWSVTGQTGLRNSTREMAK